jgi:kynureninase
MAPVVGARPSEVSCMNGLTANLHLLLVAFYTPTASRFKIIMEAKVIPTQARSISS